MFSWAISLLLLFGYHGKANSVPSVGLDSSGNRHVAPADNPQPSASDPFNVDGGGGGGH
jgi:hypothetical protein